MTSGRRPVAWLLLGAGVAVCLASAAPAAAELRRIETVGAAPIREGASPRRAPKNQAIAQAQVEAVLQVARELMHESEPVPPAVDPENPDAVVEPPDVAQVIGKDVGRYLRRFRIVEDRGENPPVFSDDPEAVAEYVVVVEVEIDVERVEGRLVEAGLIAPDSGLPPGQYLVLEVRGLTFYPAYEALSELIVVGAGARSVVPMGFARDWVMLRVESEDAGTDFLAKLMASAPPELELLPLQADGDRVRLSVVWTPPEPDPDAQASSGSAGNPPARIDTPGPNRY